MHVANLSGAEGFDWEAVSRENQAALEDQFTAMVARQSRFVFHVAYAVLRNVEDAEDAVQETFLKLYRTGAWRHMRDERAFLARAAWRAAIEKRPKKHGFSADMELNSTIGTPEAILTSAAWTAAVHQLIDSLPEELRLPLSLSSIEELNSREIAAIMGLPEGTVRRRVMRARQILKEKLTRLWGGRHEG